MVKKKVDSRIRTLIENGVATRHRSFFLIIGDRGRDQVVNLHYILSKCSIKSRPSILWCYRKELGFITHKGKRLRKIQRELKRGIRENDSNKSNLSAAAAAENPFELFLSSTNIRFCYYKESEKILGNTYQICVLQDFPSLTPNLLAKTIETVEGGGLVILLMKSMKSLKNFYSMTMDVHSRFRTESHADVVNRFNERFLLSIAECKNALVLDDELNVLPISSHINQIKPIQRDTENEEMSESEKDLRDMKTSMRETQPIGPLLEATRTLDQARALLSFIDAISEKTLRSTVALTAARGRGKSAALGLAIAAAVAYGYSNIFVTAPSPENLKTLFEMVFRGFDQLQYKEHNDYEIVQSNDPQLNKAIVRVNIFHSHRQTIQYISPNDHARLAQAELLVIDEAAAIPLPVVRQLLGPYLVFMSSTVNGYEGTGRSLSLKLFTQLERQSASSSSSSSSVSDGSSSSLSRSFRKITLDEPIRYSANDAVESWLNELLCLNCSSFIPSLTSGVPHPSKCELYYVERDTLFSHHKAAEAFLQRMMALYVSSHYKNTPNDLQLMSDAPAHHLFVLLGPVDASSSSTLPDIFCVIQVCLEGDISAASVQRSLSRGIRASGDLIPWCVSQQFQNHEFASLSGARIVRIATHPDLMRAGYASRALSLLVNYYDGKITNLSDIDLQRLEEEQAENRKKNAKHSGGQSKIKSVEEDPEDEYRSDRSDDEDDEEDKEENDEETTSSSSSSSSSSLLTETIAPRSNLPPLLVSLPDRPPELLHYMGVSYGLTQDLFNFWRKNGFSPVYLRQTANDLTGEHTCIMIRAQERGSLVTLGQTKWIEGFYQDFVRRFLSLLSYDFRSFSSSLALSLVPDPKNEANAKHIPIAGSEDDPDAMAIEKPSNASSAGGKEEKKTVEDKFVSYKELLLYFTPYDIKRLDSYARNLVDYHMIIDLIPQLSRLFFLKRFHFHLSLTQAAILLAVGLQHKSITQIQNEFGLGSQQLLAQFNKIIRKVSQFIEAQHKSSVEKEVIASIPDERLAALRATETPAKRSLTEELQQGGKKMKEELKQQQEALLASLGSGIDAFAIDASDDAFQQAAEQAKQRGVALPQNLSLKKQKIEKENKGEKSGKKDGKRSRESDGDMMNAKKK